MPVLKDIRQTKELALPSYPDSKVVIYDSMLVGDVITTDTSNPLNVFIKLIKEWNFTDDKNQPLPVTAENLKLLQAVDLDLLASNIKDFGSLAKKG